MGDNVKSLTKVKLKNIQHAITLNMFKDCTEIFGIVQVTYLTVRGFFKRRI